MTARSSGNGLPSARFIDVTFITSTRYGSQSTGVVMLYVRPDTDVAAIRAAFLAMIKDHPQFDGREAKLQVTNTTIDTVELRLVMTSANSANAFLLRADIRERMLAWLNENQPLAHAPLSAAPLPDAE